MTEPTTVTCWWCHGETDAPAYLEYPTHPQLHARERTIALCPGCVLVWSPNYDDAGAEVEEDFDGGDQEEDPPAPPSRDELYDAQDEFDG